MLTSVCSGKTLRCLKIHQQLFEEGLQEAYSTEMIIAFNELDKEKLANINYHKLTHNRIADFEVARVRQDDTHRAALEALLARKAAEETERAADLERIQKKTLGEFPQLYKMYPANSMQLIRFATCVIG